MKVLCEVHGLTPLTIERALRRLGHAGRNCKKCASRHRMVTEHMKEARRRREMVSLWHKGKDIPAITRAVSASEADVVVCLTKEGHSRKGRCKGCVCRRSLLRKFARLAEARRRKARSGARRDKDILRRFMRGQTLAAIGRRHGVSRERARQRLQAMGVTYQDGGRAARSHANRASRVHALRLYRDSRALETYGCTREELEEVVKQSGGGHTKIAYSEQRRVAERRGYKWDLTLPAWWRLWRKSRRWKRRGRRKGKYCLVRIDYKKPYSSENCHVILYSNMRRGRKPGGSGSD